MNWVWKSRKDDDEPCTKHPCAQFPWKSGFSTSHGHFFWLFVYYHCILLISGTFDVKRCAKPVVHVYVLHAGGPYTGITTKKTKNVLFGTFTVLFSYLFAGYLLNRVWWWRWADQNLCGIFLYFTWDSFRENWLNFLIIWLFAWAMKCCVGVCVGVFCRTDFKLSIKVSNSSIEYPNHKLWRRNQKTSLCVGGS